MEDFDWGDYFLGSDLLTDFDDFDDDYVFTRKPLSHYSLEERTKITQQCRTRGKESPWDYRRRHDNLSDVHQARAARQTQKQEAKREEEELPTIPKPTQSFKIAIQKARMASKLNQKLLAQKLSISVNDYAGFESGKKVMPGHLRNKANRILKTKLPQQ
jgi:ribosome-binding protein aMBF1 (putative translation factor)